MTQICARGSVVIVAAGSGFGSKPRPAIVVQNDDLAVSSRVVLALVTSDLTNIPATRPLIEPSPANGLKKQSEAMMDILVTVPRAKIGAVIGRLSPADLRRAEMALLYTLGFS